METNKILSNELAFNYKLDVSSKIPNFQFEFRPCMREPLEWKEEVYAAARLIREKTDREIWVCTSGGMDSEIVCRAFFDQNISFKALIVKHAENTNQHDTQFAINWCQTNGVEFRIETIDILKFVEEDVFQYAEQGYYADHVYYYFSIRLFEIVESVGGYAVIGVGDLLPMPKASPGADGLGLIIESGNTICLQWLARNGYHHMPFFFYATPELCLAYMNNPLVKFFIEHPEFFSHPKNTYLLKRIIYQTAWKDLITREKFHGYEMIAMKVAYTNANLKKKYGSKITSQFIPVKAFVGQLTDC